MHFYWRITACDSGLSRIFLDNLSPYTEYVSLYAFPIAPLSKQQFFLINTDIKWGNWKKNKFEELSQASVLVLFNGKSSNISFIFLVYIAISSMHLISVSPPQVGKHIPTLLPVFFRCFYVCWCLKLNLIISKMEQ